MSQHTPACEALPQGAQHGEMHHEATKQLIDSIEERLNEIEPGEEYWRLVRALSELEDAPLPDDGHLASDREGPTR